MPILFKNMGQYFEYDQTMVLFFFWRNLSASTLQKKRNECDIQKSP